MKVDCRVKIQGEDHHVRIEIPAGRQREIADTLREFASRTAYLEHYGYLPRGAKRMGGASLGTKSAGGRHDR